MEVVAGEDLSHLLLSQHQEVVHLHGSSASWAEQTSALSIPSTQASFLAVPNFLGSQPLFAHPGKAGRGAVQSGERRRW